MMKEVLKNLGNALLAIVFTAASGGCLLAMLDGVVMISENAVPRNEGLLAVLVLSLSSAYAVLIAYKALCRLFRR